MSFSVTPSISYLVCQNKNPLSIQFIKELEREATHHMEHIWDGLHWHWLKDSDDLIV